MPAPVPVVYKKAEQLTELSYMRGLIFSMSYKDFFNAVSAIDDIVWGPAMLILLVGTGIFLTVRTGFLSWRNLPFALKSTLSREARKAGIRGRIAVRNTDDGACRHHRNRQYRRRGDSHGFRRSRGPCLDVDFRLLWLNIQVHRVYALHKVQGGQL